MRTGRAALRIWPDGVTTPQRMRCGAAGAPPPSSPPGLPPRARASAPARTPGRDVRGGRAGRAFGTGQPRRGLRLRGVPAAGKRVPGTAQHDRPPRPRHRTAPCPTAMPDRYAAAGPARRGRAPSRRKKVRGARAGEPGSAPGSPCGHAVDVGPYARTDVCHGEVGVRSPMGVRTRREPDPRSGSWSCGAHRRRREPGPRLPAGRRISAAVPSAHARRA
jgi:hypothetical protein